jgi:thioredoxin 1
VRDSNVGTPQQSRFTWALNAPVWVACLCADWCHICRDLNARIPADPAWPDSLRWLWVDIEAHAEVLGDWEVDTFPTYLIATDERVLFCAPGPTGTDALLRFLMPYVQGRAPSMPIAPAIQKAHQGILRHWPRP